MSLLQTIISDSKKKTARILAEQQAKEQKKESRFGMFSNILKTGLKFVPGLGAPIGSALGALIDPIGRHMGYGADPSNIKISGTNIAFGGKQAAKDVKTGLEDYLDMASQRNITDSIASMVMAGGADKFKNWITGSNLPSLGKTFTSTEAGEYADALDDYYGGYANTGSSQGGWLDTLFRPSEVVRTGGRGYKQGGLVKKYQEGGPVDNSNKRLVKGTVHKRQGDYTRAFTKYDVYEYDGLNWKKTQTINPKYNSETKTWSNATKPPNVEMATKDALDNWRDEGRTQDVSGRFMDDPTAEGIQDILRNPELAGEINKARQGDEYALENIMEIIRQSRPDLETDNEALRASILKGLSKVDIYGQGYQDVLSKTDTTLEGLTSKAQQLRGQEATQMATSGIRTPAGGDSISEGLYKGAEQAYAGMQSGIQSEFDKSFTEFDELIASPDLQA